METKNVKLFLDRAYDLIKAVYFPDHAKIKSAAPSNAKLAFHYGLTSDNMTLAEKHDAEEILEKAIDEARALFGDILNEEINKSAKNPDQQVEIKENLMELVNGLTLRVTSVSEELRGGQTEKQPEVPLSVPKYVNVAHAILETIERPGYWLTTDVMKLVFQNFYKLTIPEDFNATQAKKNFPSQDASFRRAVRSLLKEGLINRSGEYRHTLEITEAGKKKLDKDPALRHQIIR
jgi:hypothetical protein